jgi:hypothetical protein
MDKCPFCRFTFEPDIKLVLQTHLARYPVQSYQYWFRGMATWCNESIIRIFGLLIFGCVIYYLSEFIRGLVESHNERLTVMANE